MIFTILAILCFAFYPVNGDHYNLQYCFGLALFIFPLAKLIKEKTDWICALLFSWFCISSFWISFYRPSPYFKSFGTVAAEQFDNISAHSMIIVLFTVMGILWCNKNHLYNVFMALCFIDSAKVLSGWGEVLPYGFLKNAGVDSIFISITFFFFFRYKWPKLVYPILLIPISAIFLTTTSTGILSLLGGIFVYLLFKKIFKWWIIFSVPLIVIIIHLFIPQLYSDSTRFILWKEQLGFFINNINMIYGTGPGTFWLLGPFIQERLHGAATHGVYTQLHNEYFQIFFELGLLGIILTGILIIIVIFKNIKNKQTWVLASWSSFLISSLTWNTLRYYLLSVVGAFLIRLTYDYDTRIERENLPDSR